MGWHTCCTSDNHSTHHASLSIVTVMVTVELSSATVHPKASPSLGLRTTCPARGPLDCAGVGDALADGIADTAAAEGLGLATGVALAEAEEAGVATLKSILTTWCTSAVQRITHEQEESTWRQASADVCARVICAPYRHLPHAAPSCCCGTTGSCCLLYPSQTPSTWVPSC